MKNLEHRPVRGPLTRRDGNDSIRRDAQPRPDWVPVKRIIFSLHALQQMSERGASREQVAQAIREGTGQPAKQGRLMYRLNIEYNSTWSGKLYKVKQVVPVVAEEPDRIVVVTVYTFFF